MKAKKFIFFSVILLLVAFAGNAGLGCALNHDYAVYESGQANNRDYVILIHGLYGHAEMMAPLVAALEGDYNVLSIQYPSTEDNIETIVDKYIKPALASVDAKQNIHFVAHSMGSVILRHYLKNNALPELGKVVFISPPSHGSGLADFFLAKIMNGTFGEAVTQLNMKDNSFVNQLGEPHYPCQVLMGNRSHNPVFSMIIDGKDDGMVPVASAKLDACGYALIDKATHKSILNDNRTLEPVTNYLRH